MSLSLVVLMQYFAQARQHGAAISVSATIDMVSLGEGSREVMQMTLSGVSCRGMSLVAPAALGLGDQFVLRVEDTAGDRWIHCEILECRQKGNGYLIECGFCDVRITEKGEMAQMIQAKGPPTLADLPTECAIDSREISSEPLSSGEDATLTRAHRSNLRMEMDAMLIDSPRKDKNVRIKLRDISTTGIGFTCRNALPTGTRVTLTFRQPGKTLMAKVVRCVPLYPDGYLMGATLLESWEASLKGGAARAAG